LGAAGAPHGRARRRARARSRRAAPPDADRGGLRHPDGSGARADLDEGEARAWGRADRPRRRVARPRAHRGCVLLVAPSDGPPETQGSEVACGWWPCCPAREGAYVKLNEDGTGTIVTGAQDN